MYVDVDNAGAGKYVSVKFQQLATSYRFTNLLMDLEQSEQKDHSSPLTNWRTFIHCFTPLPEQVLKAPAEALFLIIQTPPDAAGIMDPLATGGAQNILHDVVLENGRIKVTYICSISRNYTQDYASKVLNIGWKILRFYTSSGFEHATERGTRSY